jgi:hypothetical protein
MSYLQIPSLQVINSVPTYIIQMSIKTFLEICLTIMILSFIFCLIIVYKFSQRNKKILKKEDTSKENIKEEKNNLIEEELKNIKLIINLLQDEFHNKITQMEDKNNSILENFLKINNHDTQTQEKHLNNLLIDEYKNLKDEINVLTHKFTYYNSKQDENINLLKEDLRKINMKVVQQHQINQEKNNLLEENIKNISNKVVQQQRIIRNNENQCIRFNSFLDNYSIKSISRTSNFNFRLNNDNIQIDINKINKFNGIECNILRTLHSIGIHFDIKLEQGETKIKIIEWINSFNFRNQYIEIFVIQDKYMNGDSTIYDGIPLYILCLLFGTKIITFDGEDVTDLFEDNFNRIKRYHNSRELSNPESKRILDMCNLDIVREMFK